MKEKMLFNKDQTESVRASELYKFRLDRRIRRISPRIEVFELIGLYHDRPELEWFNFGWWDSEDEARKFLENIHALIEGTEE